MRMLGSRLSAFEVYTLYREIPLERLPADYVAQMWEKIVPGLDCFETAEERSLACILGDVRAMAVQWPDGLEAFVAWPPGSDAPRAPMLQLSYELTRRLVEQLQLKHAAPMGHA